MKANEFVKKHGWLKAHNIVAHIPDRFMSCYYDRVCYCTKYKKYSDRFQPRVSLVNIANLKRLVESWELVIVWRMPESWRDAHNGDVFGLEGARMYLDMFGNNELVGYELERFKQAITDVESCQ